MCFGVITIAVGLRESDSLRSVVGRPTPLKSIQLSSSSVDVINGGGYNNRYQRPSRSPPPAPRSAPPKHQTPWLGEVEDGNIDDSKSNYNIIMRPAKSPPPPPYSPPGPSNIQFVSSGSFSIGLKLSIQEVVESY